MKELSYKEPRYFIDVETISNVDLKKHGAMRYAEDPSTFITILHVYDKEEDTGYTLTDTEFMIGNEVTDFEDCKDLCQIFDDILKLNEAFSAHNILFEHAILKNCLDKLFNRVFGWDDFSFGTPEQWDKAAVYGTCTKDLASIRGYKKTSLADLTESVLGGKGKSKLGHNLMMKVCQYYPQEEQKKFDENIPGIGGYPKSTKYENAVKQVAELLGKTEIYLYDKEVHTEYGFVLTSKKITKNMVDYCQKDVMAAYEVWEKLRYQPEDPQLG